MIEDKQRKLVFSAMFLALAYILPFLTGQIQQIGNMLCPMHIPVLLCGFICGSCWGLAVGAAAPLFRSVIFGTPVMLPMAVSMSFELAALGAIAPLCFAHTRALGNGARRTYVSLICAMTPARAVWGIARALLSLALDESFPLSAFAAGAFTNALPGIVLQLIIIPPAVNALRRLPASLLSDGGR